MVVQRWRAMVGPAHLGAAWDCVDYQLHPTRAEEVGDPARAHRERVGHRVQRGHGHKGRVRHPVLCSDTIRYDTIRYDRRSSEQQAAEGPSDWVVRVSTQSPTRQHPHLSSHTLIHPPTQPPSHPHAHSHPPPTWPLPPTHMPPPTHLPTCPVPSTHPPTCQQCVPERSGQRGTCARGVFAQR